MEITDQLLNAYIDGELNSETRLSIELELKSNKELQIKLNNLKKVNKLLALAFPISENIPEKLINNLNNVQEKSADIININRTKQSKTNKTFSNWYPTAIAASIMLVLGILIGSNLNFLTPDSKNSAMLAMTIQPNNALYSVLETTPSSSIIELSNPDNDKVFVKPILSFKSNTGHFCREFDINSEAKNMTGVACRQSDLSWNLEVLLENSRHSTDENSFELASDRVEEVINSVIDELMLDNPISAENEKFLINNNWKRFD